MNSDNTHETVAAPARVLAAGGLIVYPTETLYGLGADIGNAAVLQRLVTTKGRQPGKPIAVLISDRSMLGKIVADVPPAADVLMRRFWPGPLTIVLPACPTLSEVLTGGGGRIGVRLSSHPLATALVRALGRPITAPSANPAGAPPPLSITTARAYFGAQIDYYLDAGPLPGEPASTVVDLSEEMRIIRHGAIAEAQIRAALW